MPVRGTVSSQKKCLFWAPWKISGIKIFGQKLKSIHPIHFGEESALAVFVAAAAFGDSALAVFVAGAAFSESILAVFVAGAAFGDSVLAVFVAGAAFSDSILAVFVAGAAFSDSVLAVFVAGAAFSDSVLAVQAQHLVTLEWKELSRACAKCKIQLGNIWYLLFLNLLL